MTFTQVCTSVLFLENAMINMPYTLRDLRYQQTVRKPSELKAHLKSFHLDPKFSVGIWYFAPGGGRFHDRYVPDMDVKARL